MLRWCLILFAAICGLSSCEKGEEAIVLPPPGSATFGSVDMGTSYERQIFYDIETGSVVFTSNPDSWDLAFEAAAGGRHVFLNGGQAVFSYNTHKQEMQQVTGLPQGLSPTTDTGWQYDHPAGMPEGTAIGTWYQPGGTTKGEVYLIRLRSGVQKLRLLSADEQGYTFEWMPIYGTGAPTQVTLPKDSSCNYVYFSFGKGITRPEPPSRYSWDFVFTQYRELVYDGTVKRAIPYIVTGVLLNPSHTRAGADSTEDFAAINLSKAQSIPLSAYRNAIGYDWKTIDLNGNYNYTVNRNKNYVISTRNDQLFKLHFLDFYSASHQKGTPSFEYERLR